MVCFQRKEDNSEKESRHDKALLRSTALCAETSPDVSMNYSFHPLEHTYQVSLIGSARCWLKKKERVINTILVRKTHNKYTIKALVL